MEYSLVSEVIWINKSLSVKGYLSKSFSKTVRNILSFRRTIVLISEIENLQTYFKEIKLPLRICSIINYPKYMEALFHDEINALNYRVVYIPKNIGIPVTEIADWVNRAKSFYNYRRKK